MAKDKRAHTDTGTTVVQKLLTYALIGFIAYIYLTDYSGSDNDPSITEIEASTESPVHLSVQHLYGDKHRDIHTDIDQKMAVELNKKQLEQIFSDFESSDAESMPVIELEYIEVDNEKIEEEPVEEKPQESEPQVEKIIEEKTPEPENKAVKAFDVEKKD